MAVRMRELKYAAAFVATVLVVIAAAAWLVGPAESAESDSPLVVVVLAPYMDWGDLDATPALRKLAEESAIGNVNTRSRVQGPSTATLTGSALMLSAGSWAREDPAAPGAYSLDEGYETGDVAEAYRRFMGSTPQTASIAYLGFPRAVRANSFENVDTSLGTLGARIVAAGGTTAAIGNSDAGYAQSEFGKNRPAALVAMDDRGLVPLGDVSRRMVTADENGPFGLSTDREQLAVAYEKTLEELAGTDGPGLIVVDPGDPHRAHEFAQNASPDVVDRHKAAALETVDFAVETALASLPDYGTLIVVASTTGEVEGPEPLAPIVVHGDAWEGFVSSPSTHRTGLVTLPDVTATVLDLFGIERPASVIGDAMSPDGDDSALEARIDTLAQDSAAAVAVDGAKGTVLNTFIALAVIVFVASTLVLVRGDYPEWVATLFKLALLGIVSFPLATYLMFLVQPRPETRVEVVGLVLSATAIVWLAAALVSRSTRCSLAIASVSLATAGVIIVDAWAGSPLSFTGFLSYSPLAGARYYGMGNEAAALMAGSLAIGLGLLLDDYGDASWAVPFRRWIYPLIALAAVWTAAAPNLGANVGVAAWGVVLFGVAWAGMNGVRMTWKLAVGIFVVAVLLVVAISALDLAGIGPQTHLGRALSSVAGGDLSELRTIVMRKIETNLRVLTHTNWTYVLIAVLAFLAYMRWRPRGEFLDALESHPDFGHALTAVLVGGLAAYFTEDSGIVIPALMFLYAGAGTLYVMMSRGCWSEEQA